MKWLLPLLMACTFSREKREDTSLRESEHAEQREAEHSVETKTEGPGRTVVYKFALPAGDENDGSTLPVDVGHDDGPANGGRGHFADPRDMNGHGEVGTHHNTAAAGTFAHTDSLPAHGPLVEVDVIDTGPVTDTKATTATQTAAEDVGLDLRYRGTEHDKDAPALAGFLWIALLVGAIGPGVWLAWRFGLPGRVMALFK